MANDKCSYAGCKNSASYKLHHIWSKGAFTNCCDKHTPEWVTNPNWVNPLEIKTGKKIKIQYTPEKLTANVA